METPSPAVPCVPLDKPEASPSPCDTEGSRGDGDAGCGLRTGAEHRHGDGHFDPIPTRSSQLSNEQYRAFLVAYRDDTKRELLHVIGLLSRAKKDDTGSPLRATEGAHLAARVLCGQALIREADVLIASLNQ